MPDLPHVDGVGLDAQQGSDLGRPHEVFSQGSQLLAVLPFHDVRLGGQREPSSSPPRDTP